jgi:hypothetical protein
MPTFIVSIYYQPPVFDEENAPLPPHQLILRPILNKAECALIFDAPRDSRPILEAQSILRKGKGEWTLDLSQEVIHGYERLWNATACSRGTIVIKSRIENNELERLFRYCGEAWKFTRSSERASFGTNALNFANDHTRDGTRVFMLSKTNGVEWLGIFCTDDEFPLLFDRAKRLSKPFKRWFEVSEPEQFNIIGQYHKI